MRAGWPGTAIVKKNPDNTAALVRTRVTVFTKDTTNPIPGNTVWATRTGAGTLGNPFTTLLGVPPIFFCNPGQYDVKLEDADDVTNTVTIPWEAVPGDDIPGGMILPASVTTGEIQDGTISTGDLAFDPATQAELEAGYSVWKPVGPERIAILDSTNIAGRVVMGRNSSARPATASASAHFMFYLASTSFDPDTAHDVEYRIVGSYAGNATDPGLNIDISVNTFVFSGGVAGAQPFINIIGADKINHRILTPGAWAAATPNPGNFASPGVEFVPDNLPHLLVLNLSGVPATNSIMHVTARPEYRLVLT